MRRLTAVSALLLAGCATVLSEREGQSSPPTRACTVREIHSDWEGLRVYDAAGHLLFGQTRLTYDGGGFERFSWEGDRLKSIESFYEEREPPGIDYTEGGSGSYSRGGSRLYPVRRTLDRAEFEYNRAGPPHHLEAGVLRERRCGLGAGQLPAQPGDVQVRGAFPRAGARGPFGRTRQRFEWKNSLLLRVFGVRSERTPYATYKWENGHLVAYHQGTVFMTRYAHDDAGRLVREETSDLTGQSPYSYPVVEQWAYDAAGRATRHTRTTPFQRVSTPTKWHYDARGRLAAISSSGGVVRYSYTGECTQVRLEPPPPNPLESAMACIQRPGGLYSARF